jgi:hypothetical protein
MFVKPREDINSSYIKKAPAASINWAVFASASWGNNGYCGKVNYSAYYMYHLQPSGDNL